MNKQVRGRVFILSKDVDLGEAQLGRITPNIMDVDPNLEVGDFFPMLRVMFYQTELDRFGFKIIFREETTNTENAEVDYYVVPAFRTDQV